MRRFLLSAVFLFAISGVFAQVDTFYGVFELDSVLFDDNDSTRFVKLDTSENNLWQIGTPNKAFFDSAYSPLNALVTDTVNYYTVSNHSYFDLVLPDFSWQYFDVMLTFRHKYQTDSFADGGYLQTSYDNAKTWNYIETGHFNGPILECQADHLYSPDDTLYNGVAGFSGQSNGWVYTRILWIWFYPVKKEYFDTMTIRFNFISDSIDNQKSGWMIDNIRLAAVDLGSSVADFSKEDYFHLYPNPATDQVLVALESEQHEPYTIKIYNTSGQLVKSMTYKHKGRFPLSLNGFEKGIYFVRMANQSGVVSTQKLVVK